ncbi:ABC transporter ATP-binding protein [Alphaproteobacteria bacterium]|nr:ABC transporter ATP-binding protein [Alphaproteobacteria bacterium]
MTHPALRFVDVCCRFGGEDVVSQVRFDIAPGEIVCLLGPSGCGKTTSLRLAGGMEALSDGEIWIDGQCVASATQSIPPEKRGIGFLFQDFALFPHLSVGQNVRFGIRHLSEPEKQQRVASLLEAVGLAGFEDKYPDTLSGGEQQRAALARALAPNPKLLLMDEPFSNLDPQLRDQMRDLALKLIKQSDAAGLIVTHDAADALRMADRIAVLKKGELLQIATPQEIYFQPSHLDVSTMFGPVNLVPGSVSGGVLTCALGACEVSAADGDYQIGVRPESLSLEASLGGQEGGVSFSAGLANIRAFGAEWLAELSAPEGMNWQARLRQAEAPKAGQHKFYVSARHLMLFSI